MFWRSCVPPHLEERTSSDRPGNAGDGAVGSHRMSRRRMRALVVVLLTALVASSCGTSGGGADASRSTLADPPSPTTSVFDERAASIEIAVAAIDGTYDPVAAGEELPPGFRQSLGRDAILPVYVPRFVEAADVEWSDTSLVIGVDLAGEARAYPVGFLNRREMVIDNHRGIPTLVTW